MKKTVISMAMIMAFAFAFLTSASALVSRSPSFFVQDSAGVLSESTKQTIISTNAKLEKLTGGQIVVVTVKYLEGLKSSEYAVRLMNDWGVGDKAKNNGMLLLLATEENKAWLTQGAGISASFTNNMINDLLNKYFWKDFDNGKYDDAVNAIFKQMVAWYEGYYKVGILSGTSSGSVSAATPRIPPGAVEAPASATVLRTDGSDSLQIFAFFILFALIIILFSALSKASGRNRGGSRERNEPDYVARRRRLNYGRGGDGGWGSGFVGGYMVGRMHGERHDDDDRYIDAYGRNHPPEDSDSGGFGSDGGTGFGGGGYSSGGGGGRDDGGGFDSGSGFGGGGGFDSGGGFDGGGGFSDGGGGGRE